MRSPPASSPGALGRITGSRATGDLDLDGDGDGDFDQLHVLGARSFSIWSVADGTQTYDGAADFERITATRFPA